MKNEYPLLSVIVPVYNTESFLRKCLDSILGQTYRNIEVIVVDDASPDGSDDIINHYVAIDERVHYIAHNENKGLFQARITGVEASHGEYFAFVDSDDHLSIDYYRLMMRKAVETDSDIVVGDWAYEYEDGRCEYCNLDNMRLLDLDLVGDQVLEAFMQQQGSCFSWHTVWNKVYKHNLWDKCAPYFIAFSSQIGHLIMTEDIAYSCTFWSFAVKVTNVHNAYYYYVKHSCQSVAGGSLNKYAKNVNDVANVFRFFKMVLQKRNHFDKYKENYDNWHLLYMRCWGNYSSAFKDDEKAMADKHYLAAFETAKVCYATKHDGYFGRFVTSMQVEFTWYENIKKKIVDESIEYVSFDIFDTLVLRPLLEPTDIFTLLNFTFNRLCQNSAHIDFSKIRMQADTNARKKLSIEKPSFEDVTLDEIYKEVELLYPFDLSIVNKIKEKEIELEIKLSYLRKTGKELFDLARYSNKKIILISDMYLPLCVVEQILNKSGYTGYSKIYLSSEDRLLKSTGSLYKKVIKDLDITAQRIMHIGDNWNLDVVVAGKYGIDAFSLPKPIDHFKNLDPGVFNGDCFGKMFLSKGKIYNNKKALEFIGNRCMLGVVANKIFDNPFTNPFNPNSDFNADPRYIGYFTLGMHLYAVANWVLQDAIEQNKSKIHFISRDGYLVKKAYDILSCSDNNAPKSNYVYTSRKATFALQCFKKSEFLSISSSYNIHSLSPKKFVEIISPIIDKGKVSELQECCEKYGLFYDHEFNSYVEYCQFIRLYTDNFYDEEMANVYRKKMKTYFSKIIDKSDVLFDIGYAARNELMLSNLLEEKIESYFVHINSDIAAQRSKSGNFKLKSFYDHVPTGYVTVREHLFCELAPSCIGYNTDGSVVTPVFEKYNRKVQDEFIVKVIQNSALDFVSDFKTIFDGFEDEIITNRFFASLPYEYFLHYSKKFDRDIFSESVFEDDLCGGQDFIISEAWEEWAIQNGVDERVVEIPIPDTRVEYVAQPLPAELQDLYVDGMFMAFYRRMNKSFPKGSRKREMLKKMFKFIRK